MTGAGREPALIYVEVPDFYAEVERRRDDALAGRAILVGGDPAKRGRVLAASAEARILGAAAGMPMRDALERCPGAVRRATDVRRYREAEGELMVCLRRVAEAVEPHGLGAAYLEVRAGQEPADGRARALVDAVAGELRLPLRAGVAPSKLVARLAAETCGQAGVRVVRASEVAQFLAPLPLAKLPRLGAKAAARLVAAGVRTFAELVAADQALVVRELGARATALLALARGEDRTPLRASRHPRSLGREETIAAGDAVEPALDRIAVALERALAKHGLEAKRLALRVRFADQSTATRSLTLGDPLRDAAAIRKRAGALLDRVDVAGQGVRTIGLTLAGLGPVGQGGAQLELFADD